jgi:peptidyl-prolyl cis-trans isomerase C
MTTTRSLTVLAILLGLAAATGCERKPADTGKALATVDGEAITEKDYEDYRRLREANVGAIADKAGEKKIVLDELITRTLLARHAAEAGMENDPEVATLLKRVRQQILISAVERKKLAERPITDDDLKKRFEEEAAKTHKTEYRVRHILLATEIDANKVISELRTGKKFDALARNRSLDKESARNGGDLDWINQGMPIVPEFFEAVTRLKKGEITSAPVKTEFGFHVIKVEDTRPLKIPTFEQFAADRAAKTNLYRRMQQEAMNDFIKELRSKANIRTEG